MIIDSISQLSRHCRLLSLNRGEPLFSWKSYNRLLEKRRLFTCSALVITWNLGVQLITYSCLSSVDIIG
ncbi:hypothetical protein L6452_15329 [Arctium lappa]|uniref:Uncharacterized protein n=1 Tax=Arctium lappa TaxID=4217 RepID=A0ACB9CNF5_ARCLA|nr:hypothetical protein L6452_15329 [Arctium lappa]